MASDELQKYLRQYYGLRERKRAGKISEDEFRKKDDDVSRKISGLLEKEMRLLEKEKGELVFGLSDLEELHEGREILSEQYDSEHIMARKRLLDIDSRLLKLRAGKADMRRLEYRRPRIIVLRKHAVLLLIVIFIACVLYMSGKGWIDLEAMKDIVVAP